jgi:hypothetical protein
MGIVRNNLLWIGISNWLEVLMGTTRGPCSSSRTLPIYEGTNLRSKNYYYHSGHRVLTIDRSEVWPLLKVE